jgi:WD40 repeat protein
MLVVTTFNGKSVMLWDVATGKERLRFRTPHYDYVSAALSPDGRTLALGSYTEVKGTDAHQGVHLWEVATAKERLRITGLRAPVSLLAYTPDGRNLVAGEAGIGLGLWDAFAGKKIRSFSSPERTAIFSIALTTDGQTLAAAYEYQLKDDAGGFKPAFQRVVSLWNLATGQEVRRFEWQGTGFTRLAFTRDGQTLVLGGSGGTIHFWDVTTGQERQPFASHRGMVRSVAFSPDGKTLASGAEDRTVRLWNVATGRQRLVLEGHRGAVAAVAFAPDGKTLASAGNWDNTVRVWDAATGKEGFPPRDLGAKVLAVAFAPDGKTLAAGTEQGKVQFYNPATGETERSFANPGRMPVNFIAFAPGGMVLALPGSGGSGNAFTVQLVDAVTGQGRLTLHGHKSQVSAAAFSPDGKLLATIGGDVRLWEVATGQELFKLDLRSDATRPVAFAPDGKFLAFASQDGMIQVCEVMTGMEVKRFRLPGHWVSAFSLTFSPDGKLLATGSQDTTILLWDVAGLIQTQPLAVALTRSELEARWTDLASSQARQAYRAIWSLVATPEQTVSFLKERLHPAVAAEPKQLVQLITDLTSDRFAVRDKASKELEELGELAKPALLKALEGQPAPEARRWLEMLVQMLEGPVTSPKELRALRAIAVLEHIGTPEARQVLARLSHGEPAARITAEAKASLERLAKR